MREAFGPYTSDHLEAPRNPRAERIAWAICVVITLAAFAGIGVLMAWRV